VLLAGRVLLGGGVDAAFREGLAGDGEPVARAGDRRGRSLDDRGRLDADVQRSAKVSAQWFSASPIAGTPDEIADVALFLLCDAAAYVTASRYFADGGLS